MTDFDVFISYGQVAVFCADLDRPFNAWSPRHVSQGFAWRPGSVAFATLDEAGSMRVEFRRGHPLVPGGDAERAILVPFTTSESGAVEIASISDGQQRVIEPGSHALLFETGRRANREMWCRLTFVPGAAPDAAILKQDPKLAPTLPLLMLAEPA